MSRPLLISLYVAWPLVVGVVRATTRIRRRFIAASAIGWLGATVIATTGQPADRALAIGLVVGVAASLGGWLATSSGVNFEWDQSKTYWPDDAPTPTGEKLAAALVALLGLVAVAVFVAT